MSWWKFLACPQYDVFFFKIVLIEIMLIALIVQKIKIQREILFPKHVMNPSCKTKELYKVQVFIPGVALKRTMTEVEALQTLACFLHPYKTLRILYGKPCSQCINFSTTPSNLCALCIQFSTAAGSQCYTQKMSWAQQIEFSMWSSSTVIYTRSHHSLNTYKKHMDWGKCSQRKQRVGLEDEQLFSLNWRIR